MSGIFGIIGNRAMDPGQLAGTFEQMQRSSLLLHDWYTSLAHRDTNAYIGASGLPEQNLIQLAEDAEQHHVLVLYGEIFNIVELNGQYGQPAKTTVAQILLNGILAEGFAFLQRLEGRFQAVLWNRNIFFWCKRAQNMACVPFRKPAPFLLNIIHAFSRL